MPKCYSDQERDYIKRRLKEEAMKSLVRFGIRRTTVDDLVKKVKIPKGTFYLFYSSKELLLFEVIMEQHEQMEREIMRSFSQMDFQNIDAEKLTDLFYGFFKISAEMPVLKLINSDEVEVLARKLPKEMVEDHFGHDDEMIKKLFTFLPVKPGLDPFVISSAFRSLFLISIQEETGKDEKSEEALRILLYGLARQILE